MKKLIILIGFGLYWSWFCQVCDACDVTLDWDAVSNASGYVISYSTDYGSTWQPQVDIKLVKPYIYKGLPDDKLLIFKIGAYNSAGDITWNQWAYAGYDQRKKPVTAPTGARSQ